MKRISLLVVALLLLAGCSEQKSFQSSYTPPVTENVQQPVVATDLPVGTLEAAQPIDIVNSSQIDTSSQTPPPPMVNTSLECDGAGCSDYATYFGGVSKEVKRLFSIYDYNERKYSDYYHKGNDTGEPVPELIHDMKLSNKEVLTHIKNIQIIRNYYTAIAEQDFRKALSMTNDSDKTIDWYNKNYKGKWLWAGSREGETPYTFEYKGDNTYYFAVILGDLSGDMLYNTVYGVTKQIVDGKLSSLGSTFIRKYETPEGVGEKPVIYLYPTQATPVSVKVDLLGTFSTTYPEIGPRSTRNVLAYPDGTLINKQDNKTYSYLFWEGKNMKPWTIDEGFFVEKKSYVSFLQEKLQYLGLSPKEYNEFIVYRLPQMNKYPYVAVSFLGEEYTHQAQLTIIPQPDSIQRVFMVFKGLDTPITLPQQHLSPFTRTGFSVIEWGGAQIY